MSEVRDAPEEGEEGLEPEVEETEGEEPEGEEGEDKPAPKPVDWEKRAHSHAGQAARERSRRQAAERRATDLETRLDRLERNGGGDADELLTLIGHLREDDEDPIGDIAAVKRALKLYRQREVGSVEESRAQQHATRQVEAIKGAMSDAETDFAIDFPDYREAAQFYRKERADELQELGYSGDALMAKLSQDLFGLVQTSFNAGLDPAERVYKLAVKRGFKAGGKQADKKLDALDRAGQSGIRPQARASANTLSWGDVAKLDGAAREKAWAKLREREKAKH
jgi:hypothetical protein